MIASGRARGHLTLLSGSGHRDAAADLGGAHADGAPVVRVALAPGEWALAVPTEPAWAAAPHLMRVPIRRIQASGPHPSRQRCWIAVAGPELAELGLGSAVLCHSPRGAVLYCAAGEITPQAVRPLAGVIKLAVIILRAQRVRPDMLARLRVEVTRPDDPRLRGSHYPAIALTSPAGMRLRICPRAVTQQLADAMSDLGTAYARHLAHDAEFPVIWPGMRAQ